MIALFSVFIVILVSLMIVRIATVALVLTGVSRPLARFQARSAFTGTGFTTSESEKVLQHPVRRRIIMLLMLLGNAGIVTVVSSLFLSFTGTDTSTGLSSHLWFRILLLFLGLGILWFFAHSQWIDDRLSKIIGWALKRWTSLDVRDYAGLLHLTGDYIVAELAVDEDDWLSNRSLEELRLSNEGVLVLGVEKAGGVYNGAPRGQTILEPGDVLLIYGRQDVLTNLDERRSGAAGNWEHYKAVDKQKQLETEGFQQDSQVGFDEDSE